MTPTSSVKITVLQSPVFKPASVNAWPVPDNPARCTRSTKHDKFSIHGLSRDEANHLMIALDRTPMLQYIAMDLMRLVHPLDDEVTS